MSPVTVKTKVCRLLAQMPLSRHRREVPGGTQDFRDRRPPGQLLAPRLVTIETGEQRHSGRVALRRIIKLTETETVGSQTIQVGRFNLGSITPQVSKPEVIRHDEHDVRLRRLHLMHYRATDP